MTATKRRILYGLFAVWPMLWIQIVESIIGILTLGYYVPPLSFRWIAFAATKGNKWLR